jgi:hypothetical protein
MKYLVIFSVFISLTVDAKQCKGAMTDNLRWYQLPAQLTIDRSVPFYLFNVIYDGAAAWNDAVGYEVLRITDNSNNYISQPAKWMYKDYQVAMTTTEYVFNYIRNVSVRYNIKAKYNYKAVTMHELGHVIGLAHVTNPNDIMYDTSTDANVNSYISKDNIDVIRCLYEK